MVAECVKYYESTEERTQNLYRDMRDIIPGKI